MSKRVGILTTFFNFDNSYSLASVVEAQLHALVKHGYKPVLFVHDNFEDDDKVPAGVEIRKIVPRFNLVDYSANQKPAKDLEDQAKQAYLALNENMQDIDVVIEHDLLLQGWFLPYAIAIHNLARSNSKIKWLHWVHSVPGHAPEGLKEPHIFRYTLPPNSKLVYLNNFGIIQVAEAYGVFPKDVRIVYNPVDSRLFYELDPLVKKLIDEYGILDADFLQIYPVSSPRMVSGKGLHTLIDIFSKLKQEGKKVCLVVANAHANAEKEKQLIQESITYASQKGLNQTELLFTSKISAPSYESGVSRKIISDLFRLANLFIFPSTSENCSLILLEAMLTKNLLILNSNVPAMREFGKENALYYEFGGNGVNVEYNDRDAYMRDVARVIISEYNNNRALRAANDLKQHFNYDWIARNQLIPIIEEQ